MCLRATVCRKVRAHTRAGGHRVARVEVGGRAGSKPPRWTASKRGADAANRKANLEPSTDRPDNPQSGWPLAPDAVPLEWSTVRDVDPSKPKSLAVEFRCGTRRTEQPAIGRCLDGE